MRTSSRMHIKLLSMGMLRLISKFCFACLLLVFNY
jgi:hypothetical protein